MARHGEFGITRRRFFQGVVGSALAAMVSAGLMAFTGETKADAAWRQFVKPGRRVGFKLNLLGRPLGIADPARIDIVTVRV